MNAKSRMQKNDYKITSVNEARARRIGPLQVLAERTGLEPATSDVTGRHSNQLNYHSKLFDLYC
jgi:hypothetical protein